MKQEPVDLQEGAEAPVFEAPNSEGRLFRLQDCRGRWVVLYFYPRDHTPGCTREACEFRDSYAAFQQEEAVVVGVSTDSVESHARFAARQQLPFVLVADPDRAVVRQYGVWGPKRFMGRLLEGTIRSTFLIDPHGRIRRIWRHVRPAGHAAEVLKELRRLRTGAEPARSLRPPSQTRQTRNASAVGTRPSPKPKARKQP